MMGLSWESTARKVRVLEVSPGSKRVPSAWVGIERPLCDVYRDIGDERLGGVGQHRGGSHNRVAGAHGLHIHVS